MADALGGGDAGVFDALNDFIYGRTNAKYIRRPNFDPLSEEEEGDRGFRNNYRHRKDSIRALAAVLKEELSPESNSNRAYNHIQKLCSIIRLFAGRSWQKDVGGCQHMSQATISRNLHRVCDALIKLGDHLVVFNTDKDVLDATARGIYDFKGTNMVYIPLFCLWKESVPVRKLLSLQLRSASHTVYSFNQ